MKKYGFTFLASGALILILTSLSAPWLFENVTLHIELIWFVFLPVGLVLFVLGVFRLASNAALSIWKKYRRC